MIWFEIIAFFSHRSFIKKKVFDKSALDWIKPNWCI